MTVKLYDLCVKTSKYTGPDGKEKGKWQNVGSVMQTADGGKFVLLAKWFSPAGVQDLTGKGGESILLSMFAPKDDERSSDVTASAPSHAFVDRAAPAPTPARAAPARRASPVDEDIPF